jgi:hypothetical protein
MSQDQETVITALLLVAAVWSVRRLHRILTALEREESEADRREIELSTTDRLWAEIGRRPGSSPGKPEEPGGHRLRAH